MVTLSAKDKKNNFSNAEVFISHIASQYTDAQRVLLQNTATFAEDNQLKHTIEQGCEMALILHALHADYKAVAAALLLPITNHVMDGTAVIGTKIDPSVLDIISGALKMEIVLSVRNKTGLGSDSIEGMRKMLISMINDVRIVLVKLAERIYVLRHINDLPTHEHQLVAKSVLDIYSPLANRLGIGQIKWELEDRAFRLLQTDDYQDIAKKLATRRLERETYVTTVMGDIKQSLLGVDIDAEIVGRAKHIYSIWRKMQQKNLDFEKLFDVHALRILVKDVVSCYGALGVLQEKYVFLKDEFSDYIATPKANGYQSIHTVLMGPDERLIEVQIRTFTMNEESEKGIAAHWRYKEGTRRDDSDEAKINWLRSLLDWQMNLSQKNDAYQHVAQQAVDEQVYVFTPQGEVLAFPKGATPLDFAYRIHSEVGNRCRGAKVKGKMVPLTYQLKTGDHIEVITSKTGSPSRDWIRSGSKYLKTQKAKAKVAHWFRQQNKTENTANGKEIFMKALKRLSIKSVDYDKLMQPYSLKHVDDFFAGIATGDVRINQVLGHLTGNTGLDNANAVNQQGALKAEDNKIEPETGNVIVAGEPNMLNHMAGCCKPVFGDEVIGFVTMGRGVSIHRQDCQYISQFRQQFPERLISSAWGKDSQQYQTDLTIRAQDEDGVLKELTSLIANEEASIKAIHSSLNHKRQEAVVKITLIVQNISQLERLVRLINEKSFVLGVKRD